MRGLRLLLGSGIVLAIVTGALGQETDPHFDHLGEEQGLSTRRINAITEDRTGFLWVATGVGLSRFDGYAFRNYRNQPEDASSLPSYYVRSVFTDRQGRVWVGTARGLARYDAATDAFVNALPESYVRHISQGRDGTLWLGTDRGILNVDPATLRRAEPQLRRRASRGSRRDALDGHLRGGGSTASTPPRAASRPFDSTPPTRTPSAATPSRPCSRTRGVTCGSAPRMPA